MFTKPRVVPQLVTTCWLALGACGSNASDAGSQPSAGTGVAGRAVTGASMTNYTSAGTSAARAGTSGSVSVAGSTSAGSSGGGAAGPGAVVGATAKVTFAALPAASAAAGSGGTSGTSGTSAAAGASGSRSAAAGASGSSTGAAGASGSSSGASALTGTATFTQGAAGVSLVVTIAGCTDGKTYPIHIHDGTSCASTADQGGHWNMTRGEGIPGIPCSGGTGTVSYERPDTDAMLIWKIGGGQNDVVGHVMVIHDNDAAGTRIACGKISQ